MGTGPFAVPTFDALLASGNHEISLVVTRPIKNSDDAKSKSVANPVRAWADQHRLAVIDPQSINDEQSIAKVSSLKSDLLVVCDYGQILSASALNASRLGGVNLHGSLLPRHRGAAPVQWTILRGDAVTGVCVIHMTPKLDGGPVLSSVSTDIGDEETAGELEKRLSELGVRCCIEAIEKLAAFSTPEDCEGLGRHQDKTMATPAPRLVKTDGQLDFRYPASLIDRQIRGLQPWPGVYGNIQMGDANELRVIIGKARLTGCPVSLPLNVDNSASSRQSVDDLEPGTLIWGPALREFFRCAPEKTSASIDRIPLMAVVCRDEFLEIEQIQPSGKKMQHAREFLSGYGKVKSMRFLTSQTVPDHKLLEKMQISSSHAKNTC